VETLSLARNTQFVAALTNVAAQIILGLLAVWFGNLLARLI
jgi:fluoride ion exporter CrcB/FEX